MYKGLYNFLMSNFISISDARANLPDLVNKVNKKMSRVTITVNGEPKAVLLSNEDLESLEETLEITSNPELMKELKKAEKEIDREKHISLDQLQKDLKMDV